MLLFFDFFSRLSKTAPKRKAPFHWYPSSLWWHHCKSQPALRTSDWKHALCRLCKLLSALRVSLVAELDFVFKHMWNWWVSESGTWKWVWRICKSSLFFFHFVPSAQRARTRTMQEYNHNCLELTEVEKCLQLPCFTGGVFTVRCINNMWMCVCVCVCVFWEKTPPLSSHFIASHFTLCSWSKSLDWSRAKMQKMLSFWMVSVNTLQSLARVSVVFNIFSFPLKNAASPFARGFTKNAWRAMYKNISMVVKKPIRQSSYSRFIKVIQRERERESERERGRGGMNLKICLCEFIVHASPPAHNSYRACTGNGDGLNF